MIDVKNVSMKFRMTNDKVQSLKEFVIASMKGRLKYRDFWVFRDVNFSVKKGEVIGIIGRNGAGKSTLLKIIAGVLEPTEGNVELGGNIVPMLELGSGFDVELSGRENIFLNGSILGYSEEFLKSKYEEILEFSELHDFIEIPIRNYSSGMLMRLAFSIATIVQPEILIVDEILSVGDEAFQAKSKRKMIELMGGGTTVLFVSHSIAQIRELCNRVLWLEAGKVKMIGDAKVVCDAYQEFVNPPVKKTNILQVGKLNEASKYFMDVLMIYTVDGDDYVWRVAHRKEQLLAGGISSNEVYYENFTDDLIKKYRLFIFVKCMDESVKQIVNRIHLQNKIAVCDVDNSKYETDELIDQIKKKQIDWDGVILADSSKEELVKEHIANVFINPYVASDRILQLARWANYDRDELPFININTLEDLELENYAKAFKKQKEREEDIRNNIIRIGYFNFESETFSNKFINDTVKNIFSLSDNIKFYIFNQELINEFSEECQKKIILLKYNSMEELEKLFADMDIIIDFNKGFDNDVLLRNQIIASLVKIPYIIFNTNKATNNEKNLNDTEFYGLIKELLISNEKRVSLGNGVYKDTLESYTTLMSGDRFSEWIKRITTKNIGYMVTSTKIESLMVYIIMQAVNMKQQGYDVLIVSDDKDDEEIKVHDVTISILSKSKTYIYGAFDEMVATSSQTFDYFHSYPNIAKKHYIVQGFEPDNYVAGDFIRFRSNQTYSPCIDVDYKAVNKETNLWLKKKYRKDAEILLFDNSLFKRITNNTNHNKYVTILIMAENCKERSRIDSCFRIVEKLNEKYRIWYFSNDLEPKDWYRLDNYLSNITYKQYWLMIEQSDIVLSADMQEVSGIQNILVKSSGKTILYLNDIDSSSLIENQIDNP